MGTARQLRLVLKKNFILRTRHPFVLFLEVIWPLAIFLVVASIRQAIPLTENTRCFYNARAMPSAGVLPFMQSFICNINNECQSKNETEHDAPRAARSIMKLQQSFKPILSTSGNAVTDLKKASEVMEGIRGILKDARVKELLGMKLTVGGIFKDWDKVKKYLVEESKAMTSDVAEALRHATFNLTQLYDLKGLTSAKDVICRSSGSFLVFRDKDDVSKVTTTLCSISDSQAARIFNTLQSHVHYGKILRIAALVKDIDTDHKIAGNLRDMASLFDLISDTDNLDEALKNVPKLLDLIKFTVKTVKFVKELPSNIKGFEAVTRTIRAVGPILDNTSLWPVVSKIVTVLDEMNKASIKQYGIFKGIAKNEKDSILGRLVDYIVRYGPDILSASSNILNDKSKLKKVTKFSDLCKFKKMKDVLTLPPGVPLKKIQKFFCKINANHLVQELRDLSGIDLYLKMPEFLSKNVSKPFDWLKFTDTAKKGASLNYTDAVKTLVDKVEKSNISSALVEFFKMLNGSRDAILRIILLSTQQLEETLSNRNISVKDQTVFRLLDALVTVSEYYLSKDKLSWEQWKKSTDPEVKKILSVLELSPEFTSLVLHTMLSEKKSQNLRKLLIQDQSALCNNSAIKKYVVVPPGVDIKLKKYQSSLCKLNVTNLRGQFRNLLTPIKPLLNLRNPNFSTSSTTMTDLVKRILKMTEGTLPEVADPPSWLLESTWFAVKTRLSETLNDQTKSTKFWQAFIEAALKANVKSSVKQLNDFAAPKLLDRGLNTVAWGIAGLNEYVRYISKEIGSLKKRYKSAGTSKEKATLEAKFIKSITETVSSDVMKKMMAEKHILEWDAIGENADQFTKLICNASALTQFLKSKNVIRSYYNGQMFVLPIDLKMDTAKLSRAICGKEAKNWRKILKTSDFTNEQITSLGCHLFNEIKANYCSNYTNPYTGRIYRYCYSYPYTPPLLKDLDLVDLLDNTESLVKEAKLIAEDVLNGGVDWTGIFFNLLRGYMDMTFRGIGSACSSNTNYPFVFKEYMRYANSRLQMLNDKGSINFASIFKNVTVVRKMLTSVMSENDVAEVLSAFITPTNFYNWINLNDSKRKAECDKLLTGSDPSPPSNSFLNNIKVQKALCALNQKDSNFQQFYKQIGLQDIKEKAEKMQRLQAPGLEKLARRLWDDISLEFRRAFNTLETLFRSPTPDMQTFFKEIFSPFKIDPSKYDWEKFASFCDHAVNLLNPNHLAVKNIKVIMLCNEALLKIWSWKRTNFPNIAKSLCNMEDISVEELHELFTNNSGVALINQIKSLQNMDLSKSVQCSSIIKQLKSLVEIGKVKQSSSAENCTNSGNKFAALRKIDWWIQAGTDLKSIANKLTDSALRDKFLIFISYMQSVLNSANQEKPVWAELNSLFRNLSSILNQGQKTTQDAINTILNSTVNVRMLNLLNRTKSEVYKQLCDSKTLSQLFQVSAGSSGGLEQITKVLCNPSIADKLIKSLKISQDLIFKLALSKPLYSLNKFELDQISENLEKLITQVSALLDLGKSGSENRLLQIIKIVYGNHLDAKTLALLERFVEVWKDMGLSSSGISSPFSISDIWIFVRGLKGISAILKESQTLPVKFFFGNGFSFKTYLEDDLHLSSSASKAFLNATFSISKILEMRPENFNTQVCDADKLKTLLFLKPGDSSLLSEISRKLCGTTYEDLKDAALSRIDVGHMFKKAINILGDALLRRAGTSIEDLKKLMGDVKPLATAAGNVAGQMAKLVAPSGDDTDADVTGLESVTKLMCGRSSAVSITDDFGLNDILSASDKKWTTEQKQEMADLKTPFCVDLYKRIHRADGGAIIWTYLKPLLVGRILYTPDTPLAKEIIKHSNGTFEELAHLAEFARFWLAYSDGQKSTSDPRSGLSVLQTATKNPFMRSLIHAMLGTNIDDLSAQLAGLYSMSSESMEKTTYMAQLMLNATKCISIDRFIGIDEESELELQADTLDKKNKLLAAIVFLNIDNAQTGRDRRSIQQKNLVESSRGTLPKHIKYKIRMNTDSVPPTDKLHYTIKTSGPKDNFAKDLRYLRGFVQLQDMIERAVIIMQTGKKDLPSAAIKQFPYPCYSEDDFQVYIKLYIIPITLCMTYLVVIGMAVKLLVHDKELGIEQTMKMMGLSRGVNWWAWFINIMTGMVAMAILIVIIFKAGGLLEHTDPILFWTLLVVYSLSLTMMSYMIAAFFTRATVAALVAVMVYIVTYLPFLIIGSTYDYIEEWHKYIVFPLATSTFAFGCNFALHESQGVGIQWWNINEHIPTRFPFTHVIYTLLIDSVVYFLIGWYIRNLKPGKYGIPKPWYFPLMPSYWSCHCLNKVKSNKRGSYNFSQHAGKVKAMNEAEPVHLPVGISLHNLRKEYQKGGKVAVQGLTANLYQGQITALLGENGAGKTTTINMLTGQFPPTSGETYINGRNVESEFSKIHQNLGVCQQRDVLFDTLTVEEHLVLYGGLKSSQNKYKVKMEVDSMIEKMGLNHMRNVRAGNLSGGQRRRLSVGIAFIGDSEVVILDEPTSGVDPAARRHIWDLILQNREGRTILLCTHHLDEADILADRILVLHKGNLVCSGSPLYLKTTYGDGYTLTVEKEDKLGKTQKHSASQVQSFLDQHVSGALLAEEVGNELKFTLPRTENNEQALTNLFRELDKNQKQLGIDSYGIADSPLEEVFLKVCGDSDVTSTEEDEVSNNTEGAVGHTDTDTSAADMESCNLSGSHKVSGLSLLMQQFWALLVKRFLHNVRDFRAYWSVIILPNLFITLAMLCFLLRPYFGNSPSLALTPSNVFSQSQYMFIKSDVVSERNQRLTNAFLNPPEMSTTCMTDSEIRYLCKTKRLHENVMFALPRTCDKMNTFRYPAESKCHKGKHVTMTRSGQQAPMVNLSTNNVLEDLNCYEVEEYLLDSMEGTESKRYGGWTFGGPADNTHTLSTPDTVWFNNDRYYHVLPAIFNSLSNALLRSQVKQHATDPAEYGISVYSHPLKLSKEQLSESSIMLRVFDTGIALVILMAYCFIPAGFIIYLVNENISKEKRVQYIHGVGPVLYWVTTLLWDMMCCMAAIALTVIVMVAFQHDSFMERMNLPSCVMLLFLFCWSNVSLTYLCVRCFRETSTAYLVMFLVNLMIGSLTSLVTFLLQFFTSIQPLKTAHDYLSHIFLIFPQFSLANGLVKVFKNQMLTDIFKTFGTDVYKDPFSFDLLGWNFVAMATTGLLFFVLVLLIECYSCGSLWMRRMNRSYADEDSDVAEERKRILGGERHGDDLLVLQNLKKVYTQGLKKVLAVDGICLGIPKGECFGLLGVNGAGKTTTFNMITGEVPPSSGSAQLNGSVISRSTSAMLQNIGYCPQFDALDAYMTAKEMLLCHGRLKGIPSQEIESVADFALQKMGIQSYAHRLVKTLSGGTKRKLSVAVALLGDPEMVLLDEPTSGMDPASKRHLWNVIQSLIKEKRSVVFTSHSMEECDSLCTRLAIMVNGQFSCLGSPHHIKTKFADGYTLKLRITDTSDLENVVISLKFCFPRMAVKDEHLNQVTFQIPTSDALLADIFEFIEQQKTKLGITEYSVSQTTLDQVFVNFAIEQNDGVLEPDDENEDDPSLHNINSGSATYKRPAFQSCDMYDNFYLCADEKTMPQQWKANQAQEITGNRAEGIKMSLKSLELHLDPQKLS